MKAFLKILLGIFGVVSIYAQTPVISITDFINRGYDIENAYYKDTENVLNKFEGIWLWQDGNNSLTFRFKKMEQFYDSNGTINYYEDILVGEFKYVENGVVIADFLNAMNTGPLDQSRNINYSTVMNKNHLPLCNDCAVDEYRVKLFFKDPNVPEFSSRLILRHGVQWWNQQEYITAQLFISGAYVTNTPLELSIPEGTYTLLKQ